MSFDAFDYDDYRELIRGWIAAKSARSQSMLARRVGTSRSKVGMVLAGARDISLNEAGRWSEGMDLEQRAADYFALLVNADSPVSLELRRDARAKAAAMRELHISQRATVDQARWLSRWFVGPVIELARRTDFEPTVETLSNQLWPRVDHQELTTALEKLAEVGILEQVRLHPTRGIVTPPELSAEMSKFGRQYHHNQLDDASLALEEQDPLERFFFSACISIDEADVPALREAMVRFQVEMLDRFGATTRAERVVQLSRNMFTRTKPKP